LHPPKIHKKNLSAASGVISKIHGILWNCSYRATKKIPFKNSCIRFVTRITTRV